jgi:D-glycero-D-manno-heptose 1,7-bisphosphate phosphatase
MSAASLHPAVFLDRDGTIIREVHYISHADQVELLPGAAEAIAMLRAAGFRCIVVSNQSGVGRGMLSEADMHNVQREVERQLVAAPGGATAALDAAYFCTIAPPKGADDAPDRRTRVDHPDRKPGPGMLLRAAREHNLDLARSWMIGDMLSDILAGRNAGVRGTIHVRTGHGASQPEASKSADFVADNLLDAARIIVGRS